MSRRKRVRRGISLGTIVMLALTLVVAGGLSMVLPKLTGSVDVSSIDPSAVLGALNLSDSLPQLSLSDIPIQDTAVHASAAAATGQPAAQATAAPTLQPNMMAAASPTATAGGSFTMTIGGSLCIENAVRKSAYVSEAKVYDFSEMLSLLTPEMHADLTMVSLENLIVPDAKLSNTVTTDQVLPMLTGVGLDAVALGFTQSYDQGMAGLSSTIDALRGKGLAVLGAFSNAADAKNMTLMTLGGVKVAVLHYTDGLSSTGAKKIKKEDAAFAVPQADAETMLADMSIARGAGAQVIILSLHWGSEGKTSPTKAQTALAQLLADGGADVIVGTGSQTVQKAEWLTGKRVDGSDKQTLCVYSLGCLISDSRKNANVGSAVLQLRMACDEHGQVSFQQTTYMPTYVWYYKQDGQAHYRVTPSDGAAPGGMSDDQIAEMQKSLSTVQGILADSPLTLRTK